MICSGYVRVYPPASAKKQQEYSIMIDQSRMLFNEFTNGTSRYPTTKLQVGSSVTSNTAFVMADPRNMSKTNPPPQKGKAADLAMSHQNSASPTKYQRSAVSKGANANQLYQ